MLYSLIVSCDITWCYILWVFSSS